VKKIIERIHPSLFTQLVVRLVVCVQTRRPGRWDRTPVSGALNGALNGALASGKRIAIMIAHVFMASGFETVKYG
jgi:hypothetical protein